MNVRGIPVTEDTQKLAAVSLAGLGFQPTPELVKIYLENLGDPIRLRAILLSAQAARNDPAPDGITVTVTLSPAIYERLLDLEHNLKHLSQVEIVSAAISHYEAYVRNSMK